MRWTCTPPNASWSRPQAPSGPWHRWAQPVSQGIPSGDQLGLDDARRLSLGSTYAASRRLPGEMETQVRPEAEVMFYLAVDAPDTGHAVARDLATEPMCVGCGTTS